MSSRSQTSETGNSYNRILTISNPTKAETPLFKHAQTQIAHLACEYGLPIEGLDTSADVDLTKELIAGVVENRDLILVLGGDGTLNTVVSGLLDAAPTKRGHVLAVPVGTANDFSRSQNGRIRGVGGLTRLVGNSVALDIHPVTISISNDQQAGQQHIAINNAGFNYTAEAAADLNSDAHRNGRLTRLPIVGKRLQEMLTIGQSMQDLTPFTAYDVPDGQEGYELIDLSIIHAEKAMKYGRFAIRHTDDEFLIIANPRPTRRSLLVAGARTVLKQSRIRTANSLLFFTGIDEEIMGHVDGETYTIYPSSEVKIGLSNDSFTALGQQEPHN